MPAARPHGQRRHHRHPERRSTAPRRKRPAALEDEEDHIPDGLARAWVAQYDDVEPAVVAAIPNPAMWAKLYRDVDVLGITHDDLAEHVGAAWSRASSSLLDHDEWREPFNLAGYREDDEPAERSNSPLVLWRGPKPRFRDRWCWTDVGDIAIHYASGLVVQQEIGLIWRAVVEPGRLFASQGAQRLAERVRRRHRWVGDRAPGMWCRGTTDLTTFRGDDKTAQWALDLHDLVLCHRE